MTKTISIELTQDQLNKIREAGLLPGEGRGQWKPDNGSTYYFVDDMGEDYSDRYVYDDADDYRRDSGNMFKTEAEAKHHAEYLQAINRINRYCWDNWPFVPDWSSNFERKYDIYYQHSPGVLAHEHFIGGQMALSIPFLPSEEAAEDVIAHCKNDLLTVFGVK